MSQTKDAVEAALTARENLRKHLLWATEQLAKAEEAVETARQIRDDAIVAANEVLTPREIAEVRGMPGSSYVYRLLERRQKEAK